MWRSKLSGAVSDENIRRSAVGMIRAYGKGAVRECEAVGDKMALQRDSIGEDVWQRIRLAVLSATGTAKGSSSKRAATRAAGALVSEQPGDG